jgi:formylglycine-generating enzyme required for sulfatase activity
MKSIGDYEIIKEIGSGSLGTVYLAEHRFLKKAFALKVLPEELASDRSFIARFEKEIASLATLEHPHIVKMHHASCVDKCYFLVSECIVDDLGETTNLFQYLSARETPLPEEDLVHIVQQIGAALDFAHQRPEPLAHCGIKLSNILVGQGKKGMHCALSDFGLSKVIGSGAVLSRSYKAVADLLGIHAVMTSKSGRETYPTSPYDIAKHSKLHFSFLQNVAFLAPEQKITGEASQEPKSETRSDIYAFGVLIYYLIFRKFPEGIFDLPSSVFSAYKLNWDSAIYRCLQVDPEKRPHSLKEVLEGLLISTQNDASLRPVLKPQEITRPEFEPDPGAVFQIETAVARYQPKEQEAQSIEPLLTEMRVIHGGSFSRGSNHGGRDEMPRHTIVLSSFALDVHPVTNEQFVRFLATMGGEKDGNNNDMIRLRDSRIKRGGGKLSIESGYAKHPVVGVSWYGAVAYAKWVGKRLPTEAEWEVAASGGMDEFFYPTGREIERSEANFFSSDTTPVVSYPPNNYGLYDMAGNVYEWCQDWYDYHYYNLSIQEPNNPKGPLQGVYRALRGGCWKSLKEDLRCSYRHRNNPGTMNGTYGFRCAADVS